MLGEAGDNKFYNKCSENSRSQIIFWTDVFQKLTLGTPELVVALSQWIPDLTPFGFNWEY